MKYIVIGAIALLVLFVIAQYNRLIRLNITVDEAFAQIEVQLKRRADLIPNLVETVKGYAQHEQGTLDAVIQARAKATSATTIADVAAAVTVGSAGVADPHLHASGAAAGAAGVPSVVAPLWRFARDAGGHHYAGPDPGVRGCRVGAYGRHRRRLPGRHRGAPGHRSRVDVSDSDVTKSQVTLTTAYCPPKSLRSGRYFSKRAHRTLGLRTGT